MKPSPLSARSTFLEDSTVCLVPMNKTGDVRCLISLGSSVDLD